MIVITLNIIVITSKIVLLILNCSKLITMNNIFKLIKERDLEELKRRTDILEEYLKLIGVWEEVFKPN